MSTSGALRAGIPSTHHHAWLFLCILGAEGSSSWAPNLYPDYAQSKNISVRDVRVKMQDAVGTDGEASLSKPVSH